MALDMSEAGIRVNSVSPGWIWSPEVSKIDSESKFLTSFFFLFFFQFSNYNFFI